MFFVNVNHHMSDKGADGRASENVGGPVHVAVEAGIADHAREAIGGELNPEGVVVLGDDGRDGEGLGGVA